MNYPLPAGPPVIDWSELDPGVLVEVHIGGYVSHARVDLLSADKTILWLRTDGTGHRSLHLNTDRLTLYRL